MVTSGLVAVLIKVAGVGLLEDCLGKTLGQMQGKLTKLVSLSVSRIEGCVRPGPDTADVSARNRMECMVCISAARAGSMRPSRSTVRCSTIAFSCESQIDALHMHISFSDLKFYLAIQGRSRDHHHRRLTRRPSRPPPHPLRVPRPQSRPRRPDSRRDA